MNDVQKIQAWRKDRDERQKHRDVFYKKLQAACPRLWREPEQPGWFPKPTTPETWNDLIYNLSMQIEELLDVVEEVVPPHEMPYVQQCKEKFGSLQFYASYFPPPIEEQARALIEEAERDSQTVCVVCGATETTVIRKHRRTPFVSHFGWTNPFCNDCYNKKVTHQTKKKNEENE